MDLNGSTRLACGSLLAVYVRERNAYTPLDARRSAPNVPAVEAGRQRQMP